MNFEQPYLSRNPTVFWRTWYISLSGTGWDYLYILLGGSRGGASKTYRNLMLTMLIGGPLARRLRGPVVWDLHGLSPVRHYYQERTDTVGEHNQPAALHEGRRHPGDHLLPVRLLRLDLLPCVNFTEAFDVIRGIFTPPGRRSVIAGFPLLAVVALISARHRPRPAQPRDHAP